MIRQPSNELNATTDPDTQAETAWSSTEAGCAPISKGSPDPAYVITITAAKDRNELVSEA
ncbi:hypothetical protein [Nocardia brasiliensis]|uniref:hypothetical protein n=1 Tax=Nocardia brasiliensis TaxID=37326 RepID=UPI001894CE97|nr:hypothetical protein [Nocardia brasiliensis]MBF6127691.1 hypothetical protein [Nocardia brasiliensis]